MDYTVIMQQLVIVPFSEYFLLIFQAKHDKVRTLEGHVEWMRDKHNLHSHLPIIYTIVSVY